MEKFYIIRTDCYNENWLYGMTNTFAEALKFIVDEELLYKDTAIEFCIGEFPFNYEITKTIYVL